MSSNIQAEVINLYKKIIIDSFTKYQQNLMRSNESHKEPVEKMVERVLNEKETWSKHLAHTCCLCEKCTCGKHLCKFQQPKINLKSGNTTYHDSYKKKMVIPSQSNKKLNPPSLNYDAKLFIKKSEYTEEYYRKKAKKDKLSKGEKKQDNISLGGPIFIGTTYQNSYPAKYLEPPQKIINPNNLGNSRTNYNIESSYRDKFGWNNRKPHNREEPIKRSDNIRPSSSIPFCAQSTYNHDYQKMKIGKEKQTFAPNLSYTPTQGLRAKSSYRIDYIGQQGNQCPALRCMEKCC